MTGDRFRDQVARIPTVRSHTAQFVRMENGLAVINTGDTQIKVVCPGFYPPRAGMSVQVEWRDGKPAVTGPAVTRNPIGTITGTGSPKATVTVDGVAYLLPYENWYTPAISDVVSLDWFREIITGSLSTTPTVPDEPAAPDIPPTTFDVKIRAQASGKYDFSWGNWWGGSEVWASNNNQGIWTYGNSVLDGVGAGATITEIYIYLPLISEVGSCSIGVHDHPAIPGGAPAISFLTPLSPRGGWVPLPIGFGPYLQVGGRGIGVTSPSGGITKWRGAPSPDSESGALRIVGTR